MGEGDNLNNSHRRRYLLVRKENFMIKGVKKCNDAVIVQLYMVGLPFVCSANSRWFATLLELRRHLDALFWLSQLKKTMDRTEEHGWYPDKGAWFLGEDAAGVGVVVIVVFVIRRRQKIAIQCAWWWHGQGSNCGGWPGKINNRCCQQGA